MKRKNLLLIVFFLSLFVSQQVQAGATTPFQAQINLFPANSVLFSQFQIYIYHLTNSGVITPDHKLCSYPRDFGVYGCGSEFPDQDILDPAGFYYIGEQYYLQNVLPNEMNFAQILPDAEALKAQAVASRTVGSWKSANGPWDDGKGNPYGVRPRINNSTTYQVFIPGTYTQSGYQSDIHSALTATQYQYLQYNNHAIDAEFFADVALKTTDGDLTSAPYQKGVDDPISTSCIASVSGQHTYGMSQRGAMRWAGGNVCPDGTGAAWPLGATSPIKWNYKQILAHYYTGVDFMNDNTGTKVAPDDRWNLLKHDNFGVSSGSPSFTSGTSYPIKLTIQNTSSASGWKDSSQVELGYDWTLGASSPADTDPTKWHVADTTIPATSVSGQLMTPGQTTPEFTANITAPPVSPSGSIYTLHLDLRYKTAGTGGWFSEQGWPDAEISPIQVVGASTPTPTATLANTCLSPTATPFLTPAPVGILTCTGVNSGGTCSGSGTDHLHFSYSGTDGAMNVAFGVSPASQNLQFTVIISFQHTEYYPYGQNRANDALVFAVPAGTTGFANIGSWCYGPQAVSSTCNATFGQTGTANVLIGNYTITTRPAPDWPASTTNLAYSVDVYGEAVCTQYSGTLVPTPTGSPAATPTVTAVPTFTLTPKPTPNSCAVVELLQNIFGILSSSNLSPMQHSSQTAMDINLFYNVRDDILSKTVAGQHYIDLYNTNSPEISQLLLDNRDLADEAFATLQLWYPNLQALVNGRGSSATITQEQVQAIQTFLSDLSAKGSPALQQTIANEEAQRPLEQSVGMSMDQAWAYLNGYSLTWLPPLTTANPYKSQTGSTIPIEFTLVDFKGNFAIDNSVTLKVIDANGNVVAGPIGVGDNPTQSITIQGKKYHYNFQTTGLADGLYTIQVIYNSTDPNQPTAYAIQLSSGKK
jgi:hypothetical protein